MAAFAAIVESITRPIGVCHHVRVVWAAAIEACRKGQVGANEIEDGRNGFVFDEPTPIFILLQVSLDFENVSKNNGH